MSARPVTALLLAANPIGTSRLQLDEELRHIRMKVRASDHRDAIEFVPWFAARPDDLLQTLLQYRPEIVHFSGHGSAAHELIFAGDGGAARAVSAEALRRIFRVLRDNVRLVLLNACWSAPQAEAIAESVDFTIGMERPIGDGAAITFAASFYRALGFGRSVQEAFDLGTTAVLLEGIPGETTPQLITRPGAPAPAYLFRPDRTDADRPTLIVSGLTDNTPHTRFRYTSRTADGRVVIEARDPYLDRVRAGGELGEADWEYDFQWPALDIKVVNNTGRTAFLHEAVLRVAESRTDPRPIPMIDRTAQSMCLPLRNVGWGDMTDCELRFRLTPAAGGSPPFTWRFADVDDACTGEPLREHFAAAGLDADLWDRIRDAGTDHRWVYLTADSGLGEPLEEEVMWWGRRMPPSVYADLRARALGPFRRGQAVLTGELTYGCLGRDGDRTVRTNPILVEYEFPRPLVIEDSLSTAAAPPSSSYQVRLRTDGHDYEVVVPISHTLLPGEPDRFLIRLAAERSSIHDFTLTLRYNGDEEVTSSMPVSLDLFVSRNTVEANLWHGPDNTPGWSPRSVG
jgi:hypothetical protein